MNSSFFTVILFFFFFFCMVTYFYFGKLKVIFTDLTREEQAYWELHTCSRKSRQLGLRGKLSRGMLSPVHSELTATNFRLSLCNPFTLFKAFQFRPMEVYLHFYCCFKASCLQQNSKAGWNVWDLFCESCLYTQEVCNGIAELHKFPKFSESSSPSYLFFHFPLHCKFFFFLETQEWLHKYVVEAC